MSVLLKNCCNGLINNKLLRKFLILNIFLNVLYFKIPFMRNGLIKNAFCHKFRSVYTLRFRIIGGAGIVGGVETLVYINNRGGGWNSRGLETSTNN